MAPKESNDALAAVQEPEGRAQLRGVGWYAALAELRRAVISLAAIGGAVVLGVKTTVPAWVATLAIVAIALPTNVGDLIALTRRILGAPPGGGGDGGRGQH
jgi:hypothetical protein